GHENRGRGPVEDAGGGGLAPAGGSPGARAPSPPPPPPPPPGGGGGGGRRGGGASPGFKGAMRVQSSGRSLCARPSRGEGEQTRAMVQRQRYAPLALSSGFPFDSRFLRWQGFGSIESEIGRLGAVLFGAREPSGKLWLNWLETCW